jgi:hypothetical protein
MEDSERMLELKRQGFFCSQILMIMGLELQGKTNVDLVRCMHPLAGGLGFQGDTCGALSGAACLLGLYAGKGLAEEQEDPRLLFMAEDLVKWFKDGYGCQYGGIRCDEIIGESMKKQGERCPGMVAGTFQKVKELLVENGFDLSGAAFET